DAERLSERCDAFEALNAVADALRVALTVAIAGEDDHVRNSRRLDERQEPLRFGDETVVVLHAIPARRDAIGPGGNRTGDTMTAWDVRLLFAKQLDRLHADPRRRLTELLERNLPIAPAADRVLDSAAQRRRPGRRGLDPRCVRGAGGEECGSGCR